MPSGINVYLFGSILNAEDCNDIDLIIIYDKKLVDINTAIKIRKSIKENIELISNLDIDILLLSQEEDEEVDFTGNVKTEKINANR